MSVPSPFRTKVVGVSFVPAYPRNLLALNDMAALRYLGDFGDSEHSEEPIPAVLIRNPNNEFDSNAIEVHVPAMGDDGMIGHVPKSLASRLAPLLDSGEKWLASIYNVDVDPNHPTNPGLSLSVERSEDDEPF